MMKPSIESGENPPIDQKKRDAENDSQTLRDSVRESLLGITLYHGIDILTSVLTKHRYTVDPKLRHEWLCTRASFFLERKWKSDAHMAIRYLDATRKIIHNDDKPYYHLSEALSQLRKDKKALDFAEAALLLSPSNPEVAENVENIKKAIASGMEKMGQI
ncbi:Tetratricopeptide-like helical domain superfamily [Sesbania bispinosa]|nr:Tetratricopeptide-like helical domain superfamily [Sesbania bispinosa]